MKKNNFSKYRSIVFDCDGVILDSNKIKTDAFRFVLRDEPDNTVDKFIKYHKSEGGISRYVKFKYYLEYFKKDKNSLLSVDKYTSEYSERVKEQLMECSLIPGVTEFLKKINDIKIPCAVNSGGDQEEIREVFRKRKLDHFFIDILGSPSTKTENLNYLSQNSILSNPSLFIGDALSDYLAAQSHNMDFVYLSGHSDWNDGTDFCIKHNIDYFNDFTDLIGQSII